MIACIMPVVVDLAAGRLALYSTTCGEITRYEYMLDTIVCLTAHSSILRINHKPSVIAHKLHVPTVKMVK